MKRFPDQAQDLRTLAERRALLVATASLQRLRLAIEMRELGASFRLRPLDWLGRSTSWAAWALRALALWRTWRSLRRGPRP